MTAVGDDVTRIKVGDRVQATVGNGAMAEQVTGAEAGVEVIPDSMDMRTASGFGMIYGTSYHALKQRADLQAGETLLVLGASGGVGLAANSWAR